jgi:putative (di)nucleoside polyphosphate hydrolase
MAELKYRVGVVGVFVNSAGQVLICERTNQTNAWQFPQGGMEANESPTQAILREVSEELGTDAVEIVRAATEMTQYDFPKELTVPVTKDYRGQRHHWFLMRFKAAEGPKLELSDGEFQKCKWIAVDKCLQSVVHWKKQAYADGLKLLKLME